jgi:hypothetical protein
MTDWCIPDIVSKVDGAGAYAAVAPGDRLLIPSSRTTILTFENLSGNAANYITIINADGLVTISDGSWLCFQFKNCEYIHLTGTGDPAHPYGFRFRDFTNAAVKAWQGTRYLEFDHLECGPSDPTTGAFPPAGLRISSEVAEVGPGWVQYETVVHDCYIHDVATSGMYIGDASGAPVISGVDIYSNLVEDCGTEGIQITSHDTAPASDECHIHHNRIFRCGINGSKIPANPGAGIEIRRDCNDVFIYKNYIEDARVGIRWTNTGDRHDCYDNILVDCGQTATAMGGIQLYESWNVGTDIDVYQNHVLHAFDWGIKASNGIEGSLEGNLVCSTTSGNHIINNSVNVTEVDNQEIADCANAGLVNYGGGDYHLTNASVCVDSYTPVEGGATDDYDGVPRAQGADDDVGAYEFRRGLARDTNGCEIVTVVGTAPQVQCP